MINYVFDGQHTIEAVALVSNSRETPVWCMIYDHLCYEHEAHIFAEQQKHHRSLAETMKRKTYKIAESHPAIISKEDFNRVQEMKKQRSRKKVDYLPDEQHNE